MDLISAIVSVFVVSVYPINESELDLSYRECRVLWEKAKRSGDAESMRSAAFLCRRINQQQADK